MDLMEGKTLFDYTENNRVLSEKDIFKILNGLAQGLEYLHKNKIMHRDIKPENIMFKDKNSFDNPCIVDLGLSTKTDIEKFLLVKCGTPGYLAPEIANLSDTNIKYNEKCDLFSLGVVAYNLFCRKNLFTGITSDDILIKNIQCKIDFKIKPFVLLKDHDLLEKNPEKRISAKDLFQHNYFKKNYVESSSKILNDKKTSFRKNLFVNLKK